MDQEDSRSSLQDDESEESDDSSSYHSGDSDGSQELDFVYEDLVEECRGKVMSSFPDWSKSKEVLYWIKAKAGAGKSTLIKFLYNDPRTVQLLDSATSRKTLVLTHFFYLMGSLMQCSIKGLLCTLLYQLLQQDEDGTWMAELFRRNPSLQSKELESNWSEAEVKKALFMVLRLATVSDHICIFIDGLDEVHQSDGKHKLLNFLDWLIASGPVRLCVSSRPEEEFNQALSSASILELHDLTAADMYQYARDLLAPLTRNFSGSVPCWDAYSKVFRKKYYTTTPQALAKTVVSRSDGVFLWADIATRSLQRGITYGDTWSTVQQRLDLMPPGLSELYASMWSRLAEDTRLYRVEAALCFNLVLDWELCSSNTHYICWNPKHPQASRLSDPDADPTCSFIYDEHSPPINRPISLFQLTLAKHRVLRADLTFGAESNTNFLWNECFLFYKRLPILCAGLLETKDLLSRVNRLGHEIRNPDIEVRFIHRTAKEFFTDTVEGREILSSDTSSFQKRLSALLRACYSRELAFRSSGALEKELFCLPLARVSTYDITERFLDLRAQLERKEWLEELDACQAFHDRRIGKTLPKLDFLGLAAQCGNKEYLEYVFNDPSGYTPAYKSYLLLCGTIPRMMARNAFGKNGIYRDAKYWTRQDLASWLEMVNYLLSQGCKSELAITLNSMRPCKMTGLEAFLGTLSTLLSRIKWDMDSVACGPVLETLQHFLESGADFMQTIYGYYGRDGIYHTVYPREDMQITYMFGPNSRGEQNDFRPLRQIVVEWSIFGALTRAAKMHYRDDYFCSRLEEFLRTIRMDTNSLIPRIIAVCHPNNPEEDWQVPGRWMEKAKRVSGKHEKRLMNNISQWISQNDEDAAAKMEKLDEELNQIVTSILEDRDVPEGVFGYFLKLGFVESWPRFLAPELRLMGFTIREDEDGKWRFVDGVICPPIKFMDQLK